MSRIVYFNINYNCNSNCTFCFSNSTGTKKQELEINNICSRLDSINIDQDDVIIINGGEPTLHCGFYDIVETLRQRYKSKIKIYTNGSLLEVSKLKNTGGITFIIPVHGDKVIHNAITRAPGLYEKTMETLRQLERRQIDYAIKFIMNNQMIISSFDIKQFLTLNGFNPNEVILARLNETDKSKANSVDMPMQAETITYIRTQKKRLGNYYKIKFLDIPFCYLDFENESEPIVDAVPDFYFNDINNDMVRRNYYKNVMVGENCSECVFVKKCKVLKKTYLTLAIDKQIWRMETE